MARTPGERVPKSCELNILGFFIQSGVNQRVFLHILTKTTPKGKLRRLSKRMDVKNVCKMWIKVLFKQVNVKNKNDNYKQSPEGL